MVRPAVFRPSPAPYCRQLLRHNRSGGGNGSSSSGLNGRSFHYQPNQGDHPVYFQEPKKPKKRIVRDMLLGSLLTITAAFAWTLYRYQRALEGLEADGDSDAESAAREYEDFREQFARAREAEDHLKLRDVTFRFVRALGERHPDSGGVPLEAGPLPPFPEDDELRGKERIPAEETMMFVETDEDDFITTVQVAVNLDLEDLEAGEFNYDRNRNPHQSADPSEDKLAELLWRFEWQVEYWREQDRLKGGRMFVVFGLRNRLWAFAYSYDPWSSITLMALE